ncbi:MAG: hypothetical protein E6J42_00180 [Chloroflexi bacterium]|nr:MAG: hypothetical protein E6J42_00180 [Chloroflexota bacterium]
MPQLLTTLSTPCSRLHAQYQVCGALVRACRNAIADLALDEEGDPEVRRLAISLMKEILEDWRQAQASVRRELRGSRSSFTAR